ncbi:sirohydrochlorin chelatase [Williamsia soli]|uniref:sirohydrochlorin chelatase n=1 Tax=Williamsia soli TaxID=364929 RepID=UPI0027DDA9E4|nr:sirohydrochlorin chelatase [Williamsia soli]
MNIRESLSIRRIGATPILVAHGTRSEHGVAMIADLADKVSAQIGTTRVAFVDVLGPSPSAILREVDGPAIVVPAFLAEGYHVRKDLPEHIAASGHAATSVSRALGPDPELARVLAQRLSECGWRRGDSVVLAAAGSSDEFALGQVRRAATLLGAMIGERVPVGYVATASPRIADVVAETRSRTGRRVLIASYLLAHGLFHDRLHAAGADGVAQPLGADPRVVDLVVRRMRSVRPVLANS